MRKAFSSTAKIIVALFLSLFMTNFLPVMTAHAAQDAGFDPATNHVEYWQALGYGTCKKIENPGGTSYTLAAPAAGTFWSLLVVKAGQENKVYENPQAGVAYDAPLDKHGKPRDVSHVIFCYKPQPKVEVTPVAPTHKDPCGIAQDTYTIPAKTGVIYKVNGTVTVAGTYDATSNVVVTAEAEAGYTLVGDKTWTLTFTNVPCTITVTPIAPTHVDPCGVRDDKFTIPSQEGVVYTINNILIPAGTYPGAGAIKITAKALPGYVLSGDTTWTLNFTNVKCEVVVTPPAPHAVDLCDTKHDFYTIPFKTGVIYKVNGQPVSAGIYAGTGEVVITAHPAAAHYTLAGNTEWKFTFTNVPCVAIDVDSTEPCVERGATNGEITVNVTNNHLVKKMYRVTVDGQTQTEYIAAGETRAFTFTGFGAGTYDVDVDELNFKLPFNLAPADALTISQTTNHSFYTWNNVFSDTATIDECPVPGQVLGSNTGHTLSSSTNLPSVLPATGNDNGVLTAWIALISAVATYLVALKINTRQKLEA